MIPEKDSLTHYASKYYDPVKAHEYYMRNRELKGKRSSSALNEEGKKVWASTKNEIAEEKKAASTAIKTEHDTKIEALRSKAAATNKSITARLDQLERTLAKKAEREKEAIDKKRSAELDKLLEMKIPEGLSKEERAKRIARRDQKIAKLYSDSKEDKAKVSNDIRSEKATNQSNASAERTRVATELKSAISAAREAYAKSKTSLDESYETIYQSEYDKILSEYGKKSK